MLVGCATAASLFPFVGTIVYMILRPPEYLEDVRERELEMQAAEARLHAARRSALCPHCDYRDRARLRALPQLSAQAQGALRELPAPARSHVVDLPLLRDRRARRDRVTPRTRRRERAEADPAERGEDSLERDVALEDEPTTRRRPCPPRRPRSGAVESMPPGARARRPRPSRQRALTETSDAPPADAPPPDEPRQPSKGTHGPNADPRKARRLRAGADRRDHRPLRAQGPADRGAART